MQYLNDDMDELFRKAAEDYPLNTGGANWEKLNAMLSPKEEDAQPKKNRRQLLWLLLLLPVALICNHVTDGINRQASSGSDEGPATTVEQPKKSTGSMSTEDGLKRVPALKESLHTNQTVMVAAATKQKKVSFEFVAANEPNKNRIAASQNRKSSLETTVENHQQPGLQDRQEQKTAVIEKPAEQTEPTTSATLPSVPDTKKETAPAGVTTDVAKEENKPTAEAAQPVSVADDTKSEKALSSHRRRFSITVIGGPGLSTVKFKKFSQVGFQAGILLGYDLSKRLTIEAGVMTDKKYYASDGEYLNTSKVYMPANSKIIAVDGNCRMLELPVNLQYAFSKNSKRSWFASAGLSSYLMKKEDYSYDYLYLTTGNVATYRKTYLNQTKNWLSVLQFSVGHTSKLGRFADLRVEPYYALPLKGIGYGELPLSSIGIRFGITSKRF